MSGRRRRIPKHKPERSIDTGKQLLQAFIAEDSGPFSVKQDAIRQAILMLASVAASVASGPIDEIVRTLERVFELADAIGSNGMVDDAPELATMLDNVMTSCTPAMGMFFVAVRLLNDGQYAAWQEATQHNFHAVDMLRAVSVKRGKQDKAAQDEADEVLADLLARVSGRQAKD